MAVLVKNNAFSTLASGITNVATSITLAAGTGSRFPAAGGADYFYATLINTSNQLEVVKVTTRSTDTLTVVRAQDGTTARAYSTSDRIELRVTAALLADIRDSITPADGTVTTAKVVNDNVTYAKIQNVSTTSRVLGRKTVGVGDVEEVTLSEFLDFVGSAAQGDILYRNASTWVRLAAGASTQFLKSGGAGANPGWSYGGYAPDVIIEDQKASGTLAGAFTSGADRTRTLNTLVRNVGTLATLASDQFTLPAGTYYIEWAAPAFRVDSHQSLLYNATATSTVKRGSSEYTANAGNYCSNFSHGSAVVTIALPTAFEIRHRCTVTSTNYGFGQPAGLGTETYTAVKIWRVAA